MTAPSSEIKAAATVAREGLAQTTIVVRDTHRAIAKRVFTVTGRGRPRATPTRLMHDGISTGVYAAVEAGVRLVGVAAGQGVALATELRSSQSGAARTTSIGDTRRGGVVVGALNGAWGDWLSDEDNPLSLGMTVRKSRRDIPLTTEALSTAYDGAATPHISLWLHGLCETEQGWWLGAQDQWHASADAGSHGERLQELTGVTPVYIRYNTGRHISDNGAELSSLLTELVRRWPVPVESLTLVGHSMGGLVIRSACCGAVSDDAEWVKLVSRIVYLGAPHLGAPLEVGAAAVRRWLDRLPETRPLGRALASRSVGIKDLRHGALVMADWTDLDFEGWLAEPDNCLPLLENVEHFYIGVTISKDRDAPVAKVFGDALVTWVSASGKNLRRDLALEIDRGRHLGGLNHFDLLNHPRVWDVLRQWLALAAPAPAA